MTEQQQLTLDLDAALPDGGAALPRATDAEHQDQPDPPPMEPACVVCASLEHVTERCPHGEPLALDLEPVAPAEHTNPRATRSAAEGRQSVAQAPGAGEVPPRCDTGSPMHWEVCPGGVLERAGAIRDRRIWWRCPSCRWVGWVSTTPYPPPTQLHHRPETSD